MKNTIVKALLGAIAKIALDNALKKVAKMAAIEEAIKAVVIAKDDAGIAQAKLLVAINAKDTEAVRVFRDRLVNATKAHGEALTALKAVLK